MGIKHVDKVNYDCLPPSLYITAQIMSERDTESFAGDHYGRFWNISSR